MPKITNNASYERQERLPYAGRGRGGCGGGGRAVEGWKKEGNKEGEKLNYLFF